MNIYTYEHIYIYIYIYIRNIYIWTYVYIFICIYIRISTLPGQYTTNKRARFDYPDNIQVQYPDNMLIYIYIYIIFIYIYIIPIVLISYIYIYINYGAELFSGAFRPPAPKGARIPIILLLVLWETENYHVMRWFWAVFRSGDCFLIYVHSKTITWWGNLLTTITSHDSFIFPI